MKVTTILFALLFMLTQVGYAQVTKPKPSDRARPAAMEAIPLGKNSSDEAILQRADQIRYQSLYQDYSNIATAIADSKLEVSDRLPTLKRLSEAYFFKQPESVNLPSNLLKADGKPMSDNEMRDFVNRLTKVNTVTTAKSNALIDMCFAKFYSQYYLLNPNAVLIDGWVFIFPPFSNNIPECAAAMWHARAVSDIGTGGL